MNDKELFEYMNKLCELRDKNKIIARLQKDKVNFIDMSNESILPRFQIGKYLLYQGLDLTYRVRSII